MKNLVSHRKPDIWKKILMFLFSLTFIIVWLPFIRSVFDGQSYVWGTQYFGVWFRGAGLNGDFGFLILQLLFYAGLMFSIFWIKDRRIFYSLLILWWINFFGNLLFDIIKNGDTMFHGDTLNIHVSISAIVIPLSVIGLLVVIMAIRSDAASEDLAIEWKSKNNLMLGIILGPLVVEAILFSVGEPHGITDQVGVVMALIQCFSLPFIYKPYINKKELSTLSK
ncbi:ubiquinol cytochrome C oxidoreductase [Mangrovivirga sp. M17]|uniref:Ubiquinol cytochrome C oxidoreductase n=1 Tax=Mangrovivirga halotolerans TaxID=2993936 RepID=A0ABT3RND1_9BACT|nr:ubiquinol cytochrome C oxidoreductase [Mangrovivirga halotolerans]MCX2743284.1 ubiquinol cytochrome C oxidoreductase [Mangrovivirga halotolerans]